MRVSSKLWGCFVTFLFVGCIGDAREGVLVGEVRIDRGELRRCQSLGGTAEECRTCLRNRITVEECLAPEPTAAFRLVSLSGPTTFVVGSSDRFAYTLENVGTAAGVHQDVREILQWDEGLHGYAPSGTVFMGYNVLAAAAQVTYQDGYHAWQLNEDIAAGLLHVGEAYLRVCTRVMEPTAWDLPSLLPTIPVDTDTCRYHAFAIVAP